MKEIQAEVSKVYYKYLSTYEGGLNLSLPHIPLISEAYLKNRIIIMGQETNTWYRQGDDDLKSVYLDNFDAKDPYYGTECYREFIDGLAGANKGFWKFSKKLYNENIIPGPIQINGFLNHCWINLFSVEAMKNKKDSRGRPSKIPESELTVEILKLQRGLLLELFEILKPKILIALTGWKLNPILFRESLTLSFDGNRDMKWSNVDQYGIFVNKELSEVKVTRPHHILEKTRIIQAYHPNYFMGRINAIKKLKKMMESNGIESSISEYYQNLLFEWIRNNVQPT